MKDFVIRPLAGLEWNGCLLPLGASKTEAEALLGPAEVVRGSYYYFGGELRLDFDAAGGLEFAEFLGGPDGALRPAICGADVFAADAEELCALLQKENGGAVIRRENGCFCAFAAISVGLYRELTPADIADMEGALSPEELAYEKRRAFHWATVGVGRAGYYAE